MCDSENPKRPEGALPELANLHTDGSWLGPSLLVRGEISGAEDLLIDGAVEGAVRLNDRKLTIGPAARLKADITAGDVLVKGNVKGNVSAKGWIEIGNEASITGDLRTRRILIASGASFKGSLEIQRNAEKAFDENALGATRSAPARVRAAAGAANA